MTTPSSSVGSMLRALLAGWIGLVFGTSGLLYAFSSLPQPVYHPNALLNALRGIWEVADAMGPAVKIALVLVFGGLLLLFRRAIGRMPARLYAGSMAAAVVAVLLVLALLPAGLSRGYGIGLSGQRFDAALLPLYLAGAVLGGAAFAYAYTRLAKPR